MYTPLRRSRIVLCLCLALALALVAACAVPGASQTPVPTDTSGSAPATLTIATHDSFAVSEAVVQEFEQAHGVRVQFLALGDAGAALNKVILSKDAPLADLFFGVDNTFLSRALDADIFIPYASPALADIPDALKLDPENRLLPVDYGFVTLNADAGWYEERGVFLPDTLADLADISYVDQLVVMNPATSSPGLAFLLATIAHYGDGAWQEFWANLRENGVRVADGWTEAYYEHFTVGSGGTGDRPLVVSYSTSPPADVLFATDGRTEPASVNLNLEGGVFQQIEFVGILRGTQNEPLAQAWIDFMLSETFQNDIPLQMFVYPANQNATLPGLFTQFAAPPENALTVDAVEVEANRERWLNEWTEIMLR